jgi:hypothetical protein
MTNRLWETSSVDDLDRRLLAAIRTSDVVIIVVSPGAIASNWVRAEIDSALSCDLDKRGTELVVALAGPAFVPLALRHPHDLLAGCEQIPLGSKGQVPQSSTAHCRPSYLGVCIPRAFGAE